MGYAVRKDGLGWRSVNSLADIDAINETYSTAQPALVFPPLPDAVGFSQSIKASLGGIQAITTLPSSIQPIIQWFYAAVQAANWPDVQALVIENKIALDAVNTAIYTNVKTAATQFNIPIALP